MAHFKTGWNQREVVLDVIVGAELKVGDLAKMSSGKLVKATNVSDAEYLIAQSDMTMEYGHIPVEQHDHRYSNAVAISTAAKKVAVFYITDKSDIIE